MTGPVGGRRVLGALAVLLLVFAVGCGKKEMVKSTDTASETMAAPSPAEKQAGMQEQVVSETVPPERTAMAEAEAGVAATMEKPSEFPDIHFNFDQSFIRDEDKPVLQDVADYLKAHPNATVLIEGHCDERGTAEYNLALGERRAASAKDYLVSLGVKPGAVSTVSFGKEKPLDPAHNEAAWAKNRRDHFVLQ